MTPSEIEVLFENPGPEISDSAEHRKQQLVNVLATVHHLWYNEDPELDAVAQKLGDGSRNR